MEIVLIIILLIHIIGLLILRIYASASCYFGNVNLIWAALMPIFGPLTGIIIIKTNKRPRDYSQLERIVNVVYNDAFDYRHIDEDDLVAAEEALIINDIDVRRRTMLNIMRTDTAPYIDVLKLASLNEDVEVSHYATASIMQIQNDFQLKLQRQYRVISDPYAEESDHRKYIEILSEYIDAGLLDENLTRWQRFALRQAIETAMNRFEAYDLSALYIKTLVELGELSTAEIFIDDMLAESDRHDDEIYLLRIYLYIYAHDKAGLMNFLTGMRERGIGLSPEIRESMEFWLDNEGFEPSEYVTGAVTDE